MALSLVQKTVEWTFISNFLRYHFDDIIMYLQTYTYKIDIIKQIEYNKKFRRLTRRKTIILFYYLIYFAHHCMEK